MFDQSCKFEDDQGFWKKREKVQNRRMEKKPGNKEVEVWRKKKQRSSEKWSGGGR